MRVEKVNDALCVYEEDGRLISYTPEFTCFGCAGCTYVGVCTKCQQF